MKKQHLMQILVLIMVFVCVSINTFAAEEADKNDEKAVITEVAKNEEKAVITEVANNVENAVNTEVANNVENTVNNEAASVQKAKVLSDNLKLIPGLSFDGGETSVSLKWDTDKDLEQYIADGNSYNIGYCVVSLNEFDKINNILNKGTSITEVERDINGVVSGKEMFNFSTKETSFTAENLNADYYYFFVKAGLYINWVSVHREGSPIGETDPENENQPSGDGLIPQSGDLSQPSKGSQSVAGAPPASKTTGTSNGSGQLPKTGGIPAIVFSALGLALTGTGAGSSIYYLRKRKQK